MVWSYERSCGRRTHSLAHRVVAEARKIQQLAKQLYTTEQSWGPDQALSFLNQISVPVHKHLWCDNLGIIHSALHLSPSRFSECVKLAPHSTQAWPLIAARLIRKLWKDFLWIPCVHVSLHRVSCFHDFVPNLGIRNFLKSGLHHEG